MQLGHKRDVLWQFPAVPDPLPALKDALFAAMQALDIDRLRMNYIIKPKDIYLTDIWHIDDDNVELNWLNPPAFRAPAVVTLIDAVDNISQEIFISGRHDFQSGRGSGRMIADRRSGTIAIQDTVAVLSELKANTFL